MGDSPYYRKIKQTKVNRGGGKPLVHIGGGLYVHPLWARLFRNTTPPTHVRKRK